jgi:hypothetical protein
MPFLVKKLGANGGMLADPRNGFKLQVKKEAFDIYDNKFKEIKVIETKLAEKKSKMWICMLEFLIFQKL